VTFANAVFRLKRRLRRRRRWWTANFIHECNAWDEKDRQASQMYRNARLSGNEALISKTKAFAEWTYQNRAFFGCRWMGPRPSAP
jgi:hypothetical protein